MKTVNFLIFAAIKTVWFFVRLVPMSLTFGVTRLIARAAYHFMDNRRALMLYNLEQALGDQTTAEDREEIAWRSFESLCISFAELLHMDDLYRNWQKHFRIEGGEVIDELIKQGRGMFVFGGHFGGWTSMASVFHRFPGLPGLNIVARPQRNPHIQHLIEYLASQFNGKVISTRGTGAIIEERLKNGELVGLYMDQESRRGQGIFVNFFGREASSHVVPGYLAWKNDIPMIPYWVIRERPGYFNVVFREPLTYELTDDVDENNRRVTQAIASEVERTIREHPEQWLWAHNRWRRRPDGTMVEIFQKKKKRGSRTKSSRDGAYLSSKDQAQKLREDQDKDRPPDGGAA